MIKLNRKLKILFTNNYLPILESNYVYRKLFAFSLGTLSHLSQQEI